MVRIRPNDVERRVACPFCSRIIEPWLAIGGQVNAADPEPIPPGVLLAPTGSMLCSWRNRWVAGLLGITLGPLGIHRMYLGFVRLGVLQLLLTIITLGIAGIWGFIEGVLWLVGVPMRDSDGLPLRS